MITKTHAGAGAAAAVVVGTGTGVGLAINGKEDSYETEPDWLVVRDFTVLSLESDFSNTYTDSSNIGRMYGAFLVGTYGIKEREKDTELNIEWWKKSYEKWKEDLNSSSNKPLSDTFKNETKITADYSPKEGDNSGVNTALNKVCESVYKQDTSKVDLLGNNRNGDSVQTKLTKDLLRYCSPLGEMPKTISDTGEEETKVYRDKKVGNENLLASTSLSEYVSVNNSENKIFWFLMNERFFGRSGQPGTGSILDKNKSPIFYGLYQYKNSTVRKTCARVYLLPSSNSEDKIGNFCSWREIINS